MLIPIQTMLQGRYQIIRMIAQGGIGAVYEAFDTRLQGRVAIKQLMYSGAAGLQTFEREARMMNSLRHPGLARVSDYFSEATNQFLVMDYIEGNDLAEMLAQRGTGFDVPIVLDWMHQLLTIITYLHNHQPEVLHRDIKPNNIKIAANNHLMLLDFGLSKGHTATQNFSLMGYTPHYAPLEQIQGTGTDARSDIYAVGATIYHLLTNHRPSDALTRASSVIRSQPDPLIPPIQLNPAIPSDLNMMIVHMLAQDPMQRPDSAATINHAIQTIRRVAAAIAPTVINQTPAIQPIGQPANPAPMNTQQPTKTFLPSTTTLFPTSSQTPTKQLPLKPSKKFLFGGILVSLIIIAGIFFIPTFRNSLLNDAVSPTPNDTGKVISTPIIEATNTVEQIPTVIATPSKQTPTNTAGFGSVEVVDKTVSMQKSVSVTVDPNQPWIRNIYWSYDGEYFLIEGTSITLWTKDGTLAKNFSADFDLSDGAIITWSPVEPFIALGASNKILLWDASTARNTTWVFSDTITALTWSSDGTMLASGLYNGHVQISDVYSEVVLNDWMASYYTEEDEDAVIDIAWSQDLERLAILTLSGSIQIWNNDGSKHSDVIVGNFQNTSYDLEWNYSGTILALLKKEGIWFRDNTGQTKTIPLSITSTHIEWNSQANILAIPSHPNLFYGATLGELAYGEQVSLQNGTTLKHAWSPDGTLLAVIDFENNGLNIFNIQGKLLYNLPGTNQFRSIAWNDDGTQIAIAVSGDTVEIWSLSLQ